MTPQLIRCVCGWIFSCCSLLPAVATEANTLSSPNQVELSVSPQQCTTLEQGQSCYVNLVIKWRTALTGDYCLWLDNTQLQCWLAHTQGHWQQDLVISTDAAVTLRQSSNLQRLGDARIKYAWVYQKRISKANLWRMF